MKKLFLIMIAITLLGCSKDEETVTTDQLPPVSTHGANTAGCMINGKILIPKNGSQAIGGPPLYGLKLLGGLNFNEPIIGDDYWQLEIANKKDTNGAGIVLYLNDMQAGAGNYIVNQSNGELYDDGPNNNQIIAGITENGINKTYWSGNNAGTITITRFDYANGIFSGTFSAILYNKDNPSEKIQISEGRFDINVATLNN